jgi:hypothetical protein
MLVDTSVLRGVSGRVFQHPSVRGRASVPPVVLWELLCHLDEQGFARFKHHFKKLQNAAILDDPDAFLDSSVGAAMSARVSDTKLLRGVLAKIEAAATLECFYGSTLQVSGMQRRVEECCGRVRVELAEREERYRDMVLSVANAVQDTPRERLTDQRLHEMTLALVKGEVMRLRDVGARRRGLLSRVTHLRYYTWAYAVEQALRYVVNPRTPDRNDFEDSTILKHVSLAGNVTVATGDARLAEVVTRVDGRLKRLGLSAGYVSSISTAALKALVAPAPR